MDNTKTNLQKLIRVFKDNWNKFLLFIMTGAVSGYINSLAGHQVRIGQPDEVMAIYGMWASSAFMLSILFLYSEFLVKEGSKTSKFIILITKSLAIIFCIIPFLWDFNILPYPLFA